MENKRYYYNGSIYCNDEDMVEEGLYGGSIFQLYLELKKEGLVDDWGTQHNIYYVCGTVEEYYKDYEELIDDYIEYLGGIKC